MNAVICDFCGKVMRTNGLDQPNVGVRDTGMTGCETCLDKIQGFMADLQHDKRPEAVWRIEFEPSNELENPNKE